jgi:hypothetical protein
MSGSSLARLWLAIRLSCDQKIWSAESFLKFRTSFFMEIDIKMSKHFMRKNKNVPGNCSKIVSMNEAHT